MDTMKQIAALAIFYLRVIWLQFWLELLEFESRALRFVV
jgi:hypothetical protein